MSKELVQAMDILEEEKGISRDIIKEALESALVLAYKKNYDQAQNVDVEFNVEEGTIKVFSVKEVVETNFDSTLEISLEEAQKKNPHYEIGDKIRFEVTPKDFGRIATQTAKHVVLQRLREAERDIVYNEFIEYEDEILTGTVERQDSRFIYVNLGRVEAVMPTREQIPGETFEMDQRIKVYVTKVDKTSRGAQIVVSRSQPEFLRRLFEQEVPEIYDGIVEIMSISREAGDRSKVAVRSRDNQIDPVGTCVGQGGTRVQSIVNELNGENMDIVEYSEDPATFIKHAMNPAEVIEVVFENDENACIVVVPDYQLSLAIGKKGQNARLAARLTGYKIDIKSDTAYEEYQAEKVATTNEAAREDALEDIEVEEAAIDGDASVVYTDDVEELTSGSEIDDDFDTIESADELREVQEINERVYDSETAEDVMATAEIDGEQSYDELVEETDYEEYVETLEEVAEEPEDEDVEEDLLENDQELIDKDKLDEDIIDDIE